jgi:plastocyanin
MKSLDAVLFIAPALVALALSLSGCGGHPENSRSSDEDKPASSSVREPVDAATAGSVAGIVKFDGTPRKMKAINMAAVPSCAKMHSSPATTEDVLVGDNGALQNVIVYLKGDFSRYSFDSAKSPVRIDQKGCTYSPHVIALMTGQQLQVANSDQTTHNINAGPKLNRRWNESQGVGASLLTEVFTRAETGIPVKCNVHPWMRAYISVFSNPYFQVTREDGSFKIDNVPPGTYRLTAWHELYGVKEQMITIKEKQDETISLTFTDRDH